MDKRGQLQLVFTFLFIAILIALLFLFGSDQIKKIFNFGKEVEVERFASDLKQQILLVNSYNMGSKVALDKISKPKEVTEVCFSNGKILVKGKNTKTVLISVLQSQLGCVRTLKDVTAEKRISSESFVRVA